MALGRPLRTTASPEQQGQHILQAGYAEFSTVGIRRANMELIAQRAGVSRSTLYRRFPSKEALLFAVVSETSGSMMSRLATESKAPTPQEALVRATVTAVRYSREDALIRQLVSSDPEMFSGFFGFTNPGMDSVLEAITHIGATLLQDTGAKMPFDDLRTAVEVAVRVTTSILAVPSNAVDMSSDESVGKFAATFLAPAIW
ncbi:helix-turn-helix domain-containing protein [Williamsia sp.]|uniref:TetR/AcrR family transcriptional regulator n=1 Tax=Williamsia sp. TaxID=1872085 RepID=UPI002F92B86D